MSEPYGVIALVVAASVAWYLIGHNVANKKVQVQYERILKAEHEQHANACAVLRGEIDQLHVQLQMLDELNDASKELFGNARAASEQEGR